jgi:enoyl-CoA hydratase/carnithine racemase
MDEHVRVERSGATLAITLNRPERRNAITIAMYAALADAIESVADDQDVRLITIAGEGQDFAAGNDLADFLQAAPRLDEEIPVWRFLRALAGCEIPIVAAVQGNCVGIGTTMLLHCDLVIAEEGARFSLPFVDLGLVPEAASSLLLPRLAGQRHASRLLLLCEPVGAEEARELGIVSHVVGAGGGREALANIVDKLLAKPAEALRITRGLLRQGSGEEVLERMRLESGMFAERLASDEVKQAIGAFFAARAKA